jgi:hypothetical protein
VEAKLFHADRRTDKTKLLAAFRNFAKNPKICRHNSTCEESQFGAPPLLIYYWQHIYPIPKQSWLPWRVPNCSHTSYSKQLHVLDSNCKWEFLKTIFFLFSLALRPDSGTRSPLTGLQNQPHWTHTPWDSPRLVISTSHINLPDKTQHSQQTDMPRWYSNPQTHQMGGYRLTP